MNEAKTRNAAMPTMTMTIDQNQIGDYRFEKTLGRGTFGKVK